MSTVMMRVPEELKEKLEELKGTFGLKTTYDMIDKLIEIKDRQQAKIAELDRQIKAEKERKEQQDIYLGEALKAELAALMNDLALRNPADAVAFLIANYDGLTNVSKLALLKYIELKK